MKTLKLPNGENIFCLDKLTANYVYNEIFIDDVYLKHSIKVKEGDVVFDVGANIGLFSRYISKIAPNLIIFSFEPVPPIFQVLKANTTDIDANIKIYNMGLGDQNGTIEFFYYPKVSADSAAVPFDWELKIDLFLKNYKEAVCKDYPRAKIVPKFLRRRVLNTALKRMYKGVKISCQVRTLSQIIKENNIENIDLLKIDAENYEKQVLAGIKDSDWEKIHQISMEVHEHIKGGENFLNEIMDLLKKKGFKTFIGDESRETLMGVYMLYAKRI